MPYAYGMQNSPVVGNGLGGLPRRATAVSAASVTQRRYDLVQIATSPTSFPTYSTSVRSVAIMLGGKIWKYYRTGFTPENYRWTADYSDSGYSNVQDVNTGVTSSITQLPVPNISNNLLQNYCWSIEYSATKGLFSYTGLLPFLVTVSGSDTSYVNVAAPATGTYESGGTWTSMDFIHYGAIISKNGQMLMVGKDNANNLALLRFNPETLAFIGATKPATALLTSTMQYTSAQIYTSSIGYSVGVSWGDGTTAYTYLANFGNDYVVVGHGRSTMSTFGGATPQIYGITVGPEGALGVFGDSDGIKSGFVTCLSSSTGAVSTSSLTATNAFQPFTTAQYQGQALKFIHGARSGYAQGGFYNGNNIDGTRLNAFLSGNYSYTSAIFNQTSSFSAYFDIDTKPILETTTPYGGYPSHETLCVKNFTMTNTYCAGLVGDPKGFIHIPNTYSSEGNQLFKKVYR